MTAVVFAGPSLDRESVPRRQDIEVLPPIQRGDINALIARDRPPTVIGIVDGRFMQSLSISPKEVLKAIDLGIKVFGSSSMGALRAVECAPYGMEGIGKIFDEYLSGRIDADDEVAMVYSDEDFQPISEPLVNMRFAVAAGLSAGAFEERTGESFLRTAKRLYFPERTVARVLRLLTGEVAEAERRRVEEFFAASAPDTKRDDATELMSRVVACLAPAGPVTPGEGPAA
ncbi:TfuA-like protein [Streptosporangium sp. NPDC003464]